MKKVKEVKKMDLNKYQQYIKTLPVDFLVWELFKKTGNINYYLLYSAITSPQKELKWKNSKSLEL